MEARDLIIEASMQVVDLLKHGGGTSSLAGFDAGCSLAQRSELLAKKEEFITNDEAMAMAAEIFEWSSAYRAQVRTWQGERARELVDAVRECAFCKIQSAGLGNSVWQSELSNMFGEADDLLKRRDIISAVDAMSVALEGYISLGFERIDGFVPDLPLDHG